MGLPETKYWHHLDSVVELTRIIAAIHTIEYNLFYHLFASLWEQNFENELKNGWREALNT